MKMITNDQIRQELLNNFVVQLADAGASLVLTLHENGETGVPDEETTKPGSIVETKTIDKSSVFYAVRTSDAKQVPSDKVTCIIDGDYHYISSTFESGVLYDKLYITVSIANTGSSIYYDQVVLEAQNINLFGGAEDVVLAIGNNSRGRLARYYTREFNFLIAFDGSGN